MRVLCNFRPTNHIRYSILNISIKTGIAQLLLEIYRVRCYKYKSGSDSGLPIHAGDKQKNKRDKYTPISSFANKIIRK